MKLTWRREEDFAHDQYRPLALSNVKATLTRRPRQDHRVVVPQRLAVDHRAARTARSATVDSQAVEGAIALPYDARHAHRRMGAAATSAIPVGYWRSVGTSINVFAVESMIDELAQAAGTSIRSRSAPTTSSTDRARQAVLDAAAP